MLAEVRRRFILAVVVVAIVMVAVTSIGHIKASTRMVLVPASLTDSNSHGADSASAPSATTIGLSPIILRLVTQNDIQQ